MTPLRQRMIDDMRLVGLSDGTQPSSDPPVQVAQLPRCLTEAEVSDPSPRVHGQVGHHSLRVPASRRRPCGSRALHLHQVVWGTCTPWLSNMLGTR